jgi:DNA-binding MarR family transcriptional regulator
MGMTESVATKRKFDSLQQEAYLSLWRTYDRLRALEEKLFQTHGLTAQQYNVLRILNASSESMPTLAIASKLVSRAPDITRMLDKLETAGWIDRVRSPDDRRSVLIEITAAGRKKLKELEGPLAEMHEEQLGHVAAKDLRLLCDLLAKIRSPHEPEGTSW